MKIENFGKISKYLSHPADCATHTGHDCSCGLDKIRADNPTLKKPVLATLEYLDYFDVADYLKQVKGVDLNDRVWPWLVENWGFRNGGYFWCPPVTDHDYMEDLDGTLVADLKVLYNEFPDSNGHWFHAWW